MWIFLLVIVIFAIVVAVSFVGKSQPSANTPATFPYCKQGSYLTDAEHSFFKVLQTVLGNNYYIIPQAKLSNIIKVKNGMANWQAHFNRISSKTVDFLICDKDKVTPVLVIELDDASHQSNKRMERDTFVNDVLAKAGIDIMHMRAQSSYNTQELSRHFNERLREKGV